MLQLATTLQNWAYSERFIHSIKTALACLIGFAVTHYLHFQVGQWIVITTLVVMCAQINVGSVMQKSYMRLLGTLSGSAIAILTIYFFGNDVLATLFAILIGAIIFSSIATSDKSYSDSGTLGAVTITIILVGTHPTIQSGIERCIEICLGILVAALVSQFILPIHAKTHLRRNQATTIKKLYSFYLNLFSNTPSADNIGSLQNLDEEIVKSLIVQRRLASEARREKLGETFNLNYFQQSLWIEKEIIRSIIFMFYAYQKITKTELINTHQDLLQSFHQEVCHALQNIAKGIESADNINNVVTPDIGLLKTAILDTSATLSADEKIAANAFVFCAERLCERLSGVKELLVRIG